MTTDTPKTTTTGTLDSGSNNQAGSGAGGDPHFVRWAQAQRDSTRGECDLVLIQSKALHNGTGFALHARTTIDSFYSCIKSGAFRVGDHVVQLERNYIFLDGNKLVSEDLPVTFGDGFQYTIKLVQNDKSVRLYEINMDGVATMRFKFYKHFLSITLPDFEHEEMSDAVGMLGEYGTGSMRGRFGQLLRSFDEFGFEWQVIPEIDGLLFQEARPPQSPHELCRMPTAARPDRRLLRAGKTALLNQAQEACRHQQGHNFDLCVDDVLMTGDIGLAHEHH